MNNNIVQQNEQRVNGRLTEGQLDELHRAYYRAYDAADNAAANDLPCKGELWQYAMEMQERYTAALVLTAGCEN